MRRPFVVALLAVSLFGLVACGNKGPLTRHAVPVPGSAKPATPATPAPAPASSAPALPEDDVGSP